MTRWWRWTLALLLCGTGALVMGPGPAASAAPQASAGVGTVVADLGTVWAEPTPGLSSASRPGFSRDGKYFAYLVPASGGCDVRVYDVARRAQVSLSNNHVACDDGLLRWAAATDTLQWQVDATAGDVTAYVWDADPGRVSVLALDAHVFATSGISSDGRYLAFTGRSESHPAPSVDDPRSAGYVYDRTTGISVPLSKPDVHVQFVSWSPKGDNFAADAGGHKRGDLMFGGCFGTGTSCRVFDDIYTESQVRWSRDGTALLSSPGSTGGTRVYDFTTSTLTLVNDRVGFVDFAYFVGSSPSRLLLEQGSRAVVWDRTTGTTITVYDNYTVYPSPDGRYLIFRGSGQNTWRYLDLSDPGDGSSPTAGSAATFLGGDGAWNRTGSAFLGLGPTTVSPQGFICPSSFRQWSPASNTVSLFGPPGTARCYRMPNAPGPSSSATGRFALVDTTTANGSEGQEFVVDLRRHVLIGPIDGYDAVFAPAGSNLLAVHQSIVTGSSHLLLVDPTPAPDVDDKPRWSAATPANGVKVEAAVGAEVHVQLGASDLQSTPVNLYFRWRDSAGMPIKSAPKGWSCERRRLAAGATVADCTFAPPHDHTAVRFLDVWAVNHDTGAQSDTRAYRVATRT
ncbi:WD40 repeat domain-containing protein [Microlunatus flavus]|uniref:WD40-like Beta Propeller Repeat n=1 Tax=Microlunatus flavus TaxID=1036181 RepID=A0A1H9KDM4_9ACTN|nr:WD40 repeat domain-containing protein [Microlunatus flavus]SEQ97047.1 hypothetical protein SAMN05421756_107161 [Microlunatus flavus]